MEKMIVLLAIPASLMLMLASAFSSHAQSTWKNAACIMESQARVALLGSLTDSIRNHLAFYTYFVCDEPRAFLYPGLGRLVAHMRERDPAYLVISLRRRRCSTMKT